MANLANGDSHMPKACLSVEAVVCYWQDAVQVDKHGMKCRVLTGWMSLNLNRCLVCKCGIVIGVENALKIGNLRPINRGGIIRRRWPFCTPDYSPSSSSRNWIDSSHAVPWMVLRVEWERHWSRKKGWILTREDSHDWAKGFQTLAAIVAWF